MKYGQFANESWKDYALCIRKIARVDQNLRRWEVEEEKRGKFLFVVAGYCSILALSKDELTIADVEPF